MNTFGFLILGILFCIDLFEIFLSYLNLRKIKQTYNNPSHKLIELFSLEKLKNALKYQEEKTKLNIISKVFNLPFFYLLFILGIINSFSKYISSITQFEVVQSIIFFSGFIIYSFFINLPFSIYDTFVIEKKYNFNKTTPALFIRDTLISGIISLIILSIILFFIINFIKYSGNQWWILAGAFTILFSLFLTYIYPTIIAPLFNKFFPLDDVELKEEIFDLSKRAEFPIENIYKMDASKRSTHSNAYFTGFGKKKRIVLFDTLLLNHSIDEILSILAHEIGHFKLKHIKKMLIINSIIIFIGFYLAGIIINEKFFYNAFSFDTKLYLGLFICMILFSPLNFILQPFISYISRKHEFEADNFALKLIGKKDIFINTLKKLYKDNLANPEPHNLYKVFYYSHPTLIERIEQIKKEM